MLAEFYFPRKLLESYIDEVSYLTLPKFLDLNVSEDMRATVRLPPTLGFKGLYARLRRKLYGKKLCKDIVLTNALLGSKESPYRLDEGNLEIRKFFVVERIMNTHIIYTGVYDLIGSVVFKKGLLEIPIEEVPNRSVDAYLAKIIRLLSNITFFGDDAIPLNIWVPSEVKGFACSTGFAFNAIYGYCIANFAVNEAHVFDIRFKEDYLEDLKTEIEVFRERVASYLDEFQQLKERVIEGIHTARDLALKLLEAKNTLVLTPDIIELVESYGFSIDALISALEELVKEGIVVKTSEGWKKS